MRGLRVRGQGTQQMLLLTYNVECCILLLNANLTFQNKTQKSFLDFSSSMSVYLMSEQNAFGIDIYDINIDRYSKHV